MPDPWPPSFSSVYLHFGFRFASLSAFPVAFSGLPASNLFRENSNEQLGPQESGSWRPDAVSSCGLGHTTVPGSHSCPSKGRGIPCCEFSAFAVAFFIWVWEMSSVNCVCSPGKKQEADGGVCMFNRYLKPRGTKA